MPRAPRFSFPMPPAETLKQISKELALRHRVLPIRIAGSTMTVVTPNPGDATMIQELEGHTNLHIDARQVSHDEMLEALEFAFSHADVKESLKNTGSSPAAQPMATPKPKPKPRPREGASGVRRVEGASGAVRISQSGAYAVPETNGNSFQRTTGSYTSPAAPAATARAPYDGHAAPRPAPQPSGAYATPSYNSGSLPAAQSQASSSGAHQAPQFSNSHSTSVSGEFSANAANGLATGASPLPSISTDPDPASTSGGGMPIERAQAGDEMGRFDQVEDIRALREESAESGAVKLVDDLLYDAVRMGASEIFIDPFADRFLCRARIGTRQATILEMDRGEGGAVQRRLRELAGVTVVNEDGFDTGRIVLKASGGQRVDLYLRTFPGYDVECHVLEVVRYPSARIKPVPPRGLSTGSPDNLRGLLEARLGQAQLAGTVTKLLLGLPTMIAISAAKHRQRESMMALLAGVIAGPSYGQRCIYVGERPRYYLEDQGVLLVQSSFENRRGNYAMASRMSADFLFLEECPDHEDIAQAMQASTSQHVIFGFSSPDPVDLLVHFTESPDNRRLAGRLGAVLFMDSQSMKLCEMTAPLKEAVGSMEDSGAIQDMFEAEMDQTDPLVAQSMEFRAKDVFKNQK